MGEESHKKRYLIDGRFFNSMSTGVDRYACEIINAMDKYIDNLKQDEKEQVELSVLVPPEVENVPHYNNIKVITARQSRMWTQIVFAFTCRKMRCIPINLCNEVSLAAPKGICALHDVCYAEDFATQMFPQEECQWFQKIYNRVKKHSKHVITVSEFSKERIIEKIGINQDKITVAGNGWQHFTRINSDEAIFLRFPQIEKHNYYLTVSSANPNKNVKWVVANAKQNPENQYVIGGKNLDHIIDFSKYKNIIYVGFLNDSDMKSLMRQCKAFIFPSYYEGFGVPPMEAMSTGARVVVTNTSSLPEIFGDSALYINPDNPEVNLEKLLKNKENSAERVLSQYSWEKSAEKIYQLIKSQ